MHVIYRLVGLVVKASASRAADLGSIPAFTVDLSPWIFHRGSFSGLSQTSDFEIGTLVAVLPDAWRYRVSAGAGRPGVSIP